jgi:hypothetical protein
VPQPSEPAVSLAELVLDESGRRYRFVTHYTTDVFETKLPWPLRLDLPELSARRAAKMTT